MSQALASGDWFERVPKVELHLHLEGAIPYPALWALIDKYGGDPTVPTQAALAERFVYRDFPHFIETWIWKNSFLREYEDFTFIAEAVARDLARQHIRYVEAFFSPPDFSRRGLEPLQLAEAIRAGLDQVPSVEIALIADVVRDNTPADATSTVLAMAEAGDQGVIGIGLGGSEQSFPPGPFSEVFARARRLGLHTTAHAGEAAGPASVRGALHHLQAERIGHGTRAIEDPELVAYLAEKQVPLELCPISNVRTGVVPSLAAHPARSFFECGLLVTVNTDDPKMFGNSLAGEYRALVDTLGFTRAEIRALILNAVKSAWLSPARKAELAETLRADPAWASG